MDGSILGIVFCFWNSILSTGYTQDVRTFCRNKKGPIIGPFFKSLYSDFNYSLMTENLIVFETCL